jgi:hypothetical protein
MAVLKKSNRAVAVSGKFRYAQISNSITISSYDCSNTARILFCQKLISIRNFLTLFLSIEVSKAMREAAEAKETGDVARQEYAKQMVDAFTRQMNEANPILTAISDSMTDEGRYLESIERAVALGTAEEDISVLKAQLVEASARKQKGNADLMECSARYNAFMKELREKRIFE